MNLHLANSCLVVRPIHPNKNYDISLNTLLPNVIVKCYAVINGVATEFETMSNITNGLSFETLSNESGNLILFVELVSQSQGADSPVFDFYVGQGAGTGQDFLDPNNLGANVKMTFTGSPNDVNLNPTSESTTNVPYSQLPNPSLISVTDSIFGGVASNYSAVNFMVDLDYYNKEMFEASIWIHHFDSVGNLIGISKKTGDQQTAITENKNFTKLISGGYAFLPLIKPIDQGGGKFVFQIGDPKKDAEVQVDET